MKGWLLELVAQGGVSTAPEIFCILLNKLMAVQASPKASP